MQELVIKFIGGQRIGDTLTLTANNIQSSQNDSLPYICEDEAITFELRLPATTNCINLTAYDVELPYSDSVLSDDGKFVTYRWQPKWQYGKPESLFLNYFGVTEICAEVEDSNGENRVINFPEFEVLANKLSAKRVDDMLTYLSNLSDEYLLSAFHVTKKSGGMDKGEEMPEILLDKLEQITNFLEQIIPVLCRSPITKLNTDYVVRQTSIDDCLDDRAVSWLCGNLSVLEPTDSIDEAVIQHQGVHYRAPIVEMPILKEETDIYENKVIHGFIETLCVNIDILTKGYIEYGANSTERTRYKGNHYRSFFNIMHKFKYHLVEPKLKRCMALSERMYRIKHYLNKLLPISYSVREIPHVTPKVRTNRPYFDVFYKITQWNEKLKPNWLLYDNLMGIKSIPILFEHYTYCRVAETLTKVFPVSNRVKNSFVFTDVIGNNIKLVKEPSYWTVEHKNSKDADFVNTEGWTEYNENRKKELRKRGSKGINARRAPDIVIELIKPNGMKRLMIMDAKYTYAVKAFSTYLPELTMKYVHGIHSVNTGDSVIDSLTIIYPDDSGNIHRFHHDDYAFDGSTPAKPALQTVSLVPALENSDELSYMVGKLLTLSGVVFVRTNVISIAS